MAPLHISSLKNPKVKQWLQFHKGHYRNKSDSFMVEGIRECYSASNSVFRMQQLIYCAALLSKEDLGKILENIDSSTQVFTVSENVYAKIAYREASEGVMAICSKNDRNLDEIEIQKENSNYFILVENPEKPGNLGAILRTADAVGARALIITGSATDHYNPNVIRASLGTFFQLAVIKSNNDEILEWAQKEKIKIFSAALPSYSNMYEIDFPKNCICAFGAESTGLTDFWKKQSDENFTIPMTGKADSLNLSVSVAIVSYEVFRRNNVI